MSVRLLGEGINRVAPADDEIEVSIFGPGFGECIVIHLGCGEWMVVDSCVSPATKEPAALTYLDDLGVDVTKAVLMVVATHWHDDHVRGISQLYESALSAQFYASAALSAPEFLALAKRPDLVSRFSRGVDELAKVSSIISEKANAGRKSIELVSAVKRLWHSERCPVRAVWGLSPSAEDLGRSIEHISTLLPPSLAGAARVPSLKPNDASVVVLLETIAGGILLGGDLEHFRSTRSRGWHALLDHAGRPKQGASVFKVPHHGSEDADCPEVWEHAVASDALCVLSPFGWGKAPLPRPADRSRIRGRTAHGYTTSDKRGTAVRRDRVAQKMIAEATRSYRPMNLLMGQVQARARTRGEWAVRLSPEASLI